MVRSVEPPAQSTLTYLGLGWQGWMQAKGRRAGKSSQACSMCDSDSAESSCTAPAGATVVRQCPGGFTLELPFLFVDARPPLAGLTS